MNVGNLINLNFKRADRNLVEKFKNIPVANIADCMNRTSALSQEIEPVNDVHILGTAFTVKVAQGDNLMFHKAMDLAKEGDVIIIDSMGTKNRAILGEIMATYCKTRGIAGIVVDGPIRDIEDIAKMDMPVYAVGSTPNGPYKNGPGEIGTTISVGGQVVNPGDIIVGDKDGIIVIKKEDAEELLEKSLATLDKEKKIFEVMEKEGTYIRPWVDDVLESTGVTIIEEE